MYLQKQSSKKRAFAPVSAKRRKQRRIKIIFFFCVFFICLILFLWCVNKSIQYVFEHKSDWFTWRAQELKIEASDDHTLEQIKKIIDFKQDSLISREEANTMQNTLQSKLPQVKEVKVKRGFFSKELTVKAKNHEILAKIEVKQKPYLLSDTGVLFVYDQAKIPQDILLVKTEDEIKGSFLPQELVKLLKDISKSKLEDLAFVEVNSQDKSFTLHFKNDIVVAMGLFDLYNEKIAVLKKITDTAQKKGFKKPYKIDFNYFKNGKIYLNNQV